MKTSYCLDSLLFMYEQIMNEGFICRKKTLEYSEAVNTDAFEHAKEILRYFLLEIIRYDKYLLHNYKNNNYIMIDKNFIIDEREKYFQFKRILYPNENQLVKFYSKLFNNSKIWPYFLYNQQIISKELFLKLTDKILITSHNTKSLKVLIIYHNIQIINKFSLDDVMKKLNVSRRTVFYYIEKINSFMDTQNKGYRIINCKKEKLYKLTQHEEE